MTSLSVILQQLLIMFIYTFIGYILYRRKMLDAAATRQIGAVLIYIVNPCLMFVSFLQDFSMAKLIAFGLAFVYALILILLGIVIGRMILGKEKTLEQYACGFTNASFFGIPLVTGLLGEKYVFYINAFVMAFNILTWTVGIRLISGKTDFSLKRFLGNPQIFCIFIGLLFFIMEWKVPDVLLSVLNGLGSMNTPLAMILLGTYIASAPLSAVFTNRTGYLVSVIRLLIVPAAALLFLKAVYSPDAAMKTVMMICAAAPCGTMLAMLAQQYGSDYSYGAELVSLSTLLSPATLVLFLTLAAELF